MSAHNCLPLFRASYHQLIGLVITPCNPARGKATRNDLVGREPEGGAQYVNEGSKLLDMARRSTGERQNEWCTRFIEFMALNIKNTLISDGLLIDKIDQRAKGLAELITLEEIDGRVFSERNAAAVIGVSQTAYRKTWSAHKLRFLKTLYFS